MEILSVQPVSRDGYLIYNYGLPRLLPSVVLYNNSMAYSDIHEDSIVIINSHGDEKNVPTKYSRIFVGDLNDQYLVWELYKSVFYYNRSNNSVVELSGGLSPQIEGETVAFIRMDAERKCMLILQDINSNNIITKFPLSTIDENIDFPSYFLFEKNKIYVKSSKTKLSIIHIEENITMEEINMDLQFGDFDVDNNFTYFAAYPNDDTRGQIIRYNMSREIFEPIYDCSKTISDFEMNEDEIGAVGQN